MEKAKITLDIHPLLSGIEIKNPSQKFLSALKDGKNTIWDISDKISEEDKKRIKQFAIKYGSDKDCNLGFWYAYCSGYAMELFVKIKTDGTEYITINTYKGYRREGELRQGRPAGHSGSQKVWWTGEYSASMHYATMDKQLYRNYKSKLYRYPVK